MATWKSENSFLTSVGEDILNKLKVGQGAITISRIVTGSGRVAPSQLYRQTTVSGVQKECTINYTKTEDTGSEISFSITNSGFTEPYTINQIGVFVTHPDYVGEQLYHISQCEEDDPDVLTEHTDSIVTLRYSLYLIHGNSSSISITVDPDGMVSEEEFNDFKTEIGAKFTELNNSVTALKDSFNSFKSGIKAGKLVTVDSNGNLIASGKNTVRGQSITVNDAISHRALSLSIEGKSTQATSPSPSAPVYTTDSKVTSIGVSDGSNQKLITFPSVIQLRSIGDYADTIEWDGAKWWKVQRIAEVIVDGTNVSFGRPAHANSANYSRGTLYTLDSANKVQTFNDALPTSPVLTSHGNDSPSTSAKFYGFLETVSGTSQVRVQLHLLHTAIGLQAGQKDATTRLNEIVPWFKAQNTAGTPVKVWYVLNTPIVTEISLTEVLEMYANHTTVTCSVEGNAVNMALSYALNTTDSTIMYILKSLERKSNVQAANTFAVAELLE